MTEVRKLLSQYSCTIKSLLGIHAADATTCTAGYLQLKAGYDRELATEYEEVDLLLEGTLSSMADGGSFTAWPGDLVLIEQGSRVLWYALMKYPSCFTTFIDH